MAGPQAGGAQFETCVIKLARYLLPSPKREDPRSLNLARISHVKLFEKNPDSLHIRLVEPLLNQPSITGIPLNSRAMQGARDYATKFMGLVRNLFREDGVCMGHGFLPPSARAEYEVALLAWLEWCTAWEAYFKSTKMRGVLIDHLQTKTLPNVHNNELNRPFDFGFRKARERYSLMLGELTGEEATLQRVAPREVTLLQVVELWQQSGAPDAPDNNAVRQYHLGCPW